MHERSVDQERLPCRAWNAWPEWRPDATVRESNAAILKMPKKRLWAHIDQLFFRDTCQRYARSSPQRCIGTMWYCWLLCLVAGPIWEKVAYNKRTHGSIEHSDLYIRRSEVSDEPVASIDTSCSSPSNVSLGPNTHQDTSDDELSLMDLDQNNSFPQLLVAQSKQEITHKSLPLKSQSVVSEKKKSRKEIDLTDETSNETKSKGELEARSAVIDLSIRSCVATFRIGKYSDRTINDDALFLTLLNNKWEKLRLTDQVKVFLFKAMKAKTESVIRDVDAETHSFQDSDLPLQHILRLIAISKISTCAKKDKIGAEIAQVRCDFELHNLVEEAGIAADPTEILKKGNPVDIRKAIYYNKLAKMNFLRIEGSLVI